MSDNRNSENQSFDILISRYLSGECTKQEKKKIFEKIEHNSQYREQFESLKSTWKLSGRLELENDADDTWAKISENLSKRSGVEPIPLDNNKSGNKYRFAKPGGRSGWGIFFKVAAGILLVASMIVTYFIVDPQNTTGEGESGQPVMEEISAERGQRLHLAFKDGSRAILNAASTIRYPKEFTGDQKRVYLKGEAFFNISPQQNSSFVVYSDNAEIEVVGTEFNVSAYPEENATEVVVAKGKVNVNAHQQSPTSNKTKDPQLSGKVVLEQGQITTIGSNSTPTPPRQADLEYHLAWFNDQFIFKSEPLGKVITKLNRYYNSNIKVAEPGLNDMLLTATFERESLNRVLEVISKSLGLAVKKDSNQVVLRDKRYQSAE